MNNNLRKILKKLVGEGYKLKAQHNNTDWKNALENAEALLIDKRTLDNLDDYYIDELVDIRSKARDNKDWELADKLRNYLDTNLRNSKLESILN
jgi:cysteinyl-tRNA synthetase